MDPWEEGDETHEATTWIALGDLMTGLMIIFLVLCLAALVQAAQLHTQQMAYMQQQVTKSHQAMKQISKTLNTIEQVNEARIVIIKQVQDALNKNHIAVQLDAKTGDISITNSILFDEDSDSLKPEGKRFLDGFIPVYAQAILHQCNVSDEVTRLGVEGHTSSGGAPLHNMRLSLGRANAVIEYVYNMPLFPYKLGLIRKLTPMGRGRLDANWEIDEPIDRKVVFRFQFRGEFEKWQQLTGQVVGSPSTAMWRGVKLCGAIE